MAHKRNGTLDSFAITLGARGRIVLPAGLRKTLGLRPNDRLVLVLNADGTVQIVSARDQVRKAMGMFAGLAPGRRLSDELIRERRAEARKEERE